MKLTDQEQVILKAIRSLLRTPTSPALIADVVKAVGYPKATTKKLLAQMAEKGVIAVHRHDYPQSLTPAERKLMLRLKDGRGNWYYFNAVSMRKRNPKKSKGKAALKKTGRALKGFARGALSAGAEILGAGAMALNPSRRIKVRNKYIDLVIKGRAKKTPQGWKVGQKTFAQGRGTVNVSSGYYLDKATGLVYAKRERNAAKKKRAKKKAGKRNASRAVHPARKAKTGRVGVVGKTGRKSIRARGKQKRMAKRKVASTARTKSRVQARKATAKRITRNPSPESIRKTFAGSVSGSRDLFFPQGTPQGLAKLGKLVSITTEEGTIKPVSGTAWLCADTNEKLHIGSTTNAPLFSGPARSFGKVSKIEYESSKPHLGYRGPIIWFHRVGEETGVKPTLHADGKGGLVFKGGQYRLTRRGIEN